MNTYLVVSTSVRKGARRVLIESRHGKRLTLELHRFALIGKNNRIQMTMGVEKKIFSKNAEDDSDPIQISPAFSVSSVLRAGGENINLSIKEISGDTEFNDYKFLETFHYKSIDFSASDKNGELKLKDTSGGRKAILLCQAKFGNRTMSVGYIELHMPLLMCKPRHVLFAKPFMHPERPIVWQKWDQTARKNVNTICRIARIVIHPEFRSLSLTKPIIGAAQAFARERWHVAGVRPLFMEISAEMLNYIDFVSTAGFVNVGRTEGNLARIYKDMKSMSKGKDVGFIDKYQINSGIMSLQKKYHTALSNYCLKANCTFEEARERLKKIVESESPRAEMTVDEWFGFRSILRFPIPYYMCGLDEYAKKYIGKKSSSISPAKANSKNSEDREFNGIDIRNLEISMDFKIPMNEHTKIILDSFGISAERITTRLVGPVDIVAQKGAIVFVSGASGSGKSLILDALTSSEVRAAENLTIKFDGDRKYISRWLSPLPNDIALFEYFAEKVGAERAFSVLSSVGLSEAMVFVKPFKLLSKGQQYRAMLADLLLSNAEVWLVDEFCSDLDPLTAKIVAAKIRKMAGMLGVVVVAAAANHGHFLGALRPNRVIVLMAGAPPRQINYREYRDEFL